MKIIERGDTLTTQFWDCECESDYIHPKNQLKCRKCDVLAEDQPDSHINEIKGDTKITRLL